MVNNDLNDIFIRKTDADFISEKEKILRLKLRAWDEINSLAQDSDENNMIHEDNLIDFFLDNASQKFPWELNKIVDSKICAKCGTCSIVCPNDLIVFDNYPFINEACLRDGNGMCYNVCPRISSGSLPIISKLNNYSNYYSTKDFMGDDSALINHILECLIDDEKIDGAIFVGNYKWKPISMIVVNKDEIEDTTKKHYTISTLEAIKEAADMGLEKIAVVGLPCQIAGLRNVQLYKDKTGNDFEKGHDNDIRNIPKIEYLIGVFCKAKYEHDEMLKVLTDKNINIGGIKSFKTENNKLIVLTDDGETVINLNKELNPTPGCLMCNDFDANLADISIGDAGSDDDANTIIVRNKKGEEIKNYLNITSEVDVNDVNRLINNKHNRFENEIKRREENFEYNSYYYIWKYPGIIPASNNLLNIKLPSSIGGYFTPDYLLKISEIAKKYNGVVKLTVRCDFHIENIHPKYIEELFEDLSDITQLNTTPLNNPIITCPGSDFCKRGLIDTRNLTVKFDEILSNSKLPFKFKSVIDGCPYRCSRPSTCDFGVNAVIKPEINSDCVGCGACVESCTINAIKLKDTKAIMDFDKCIGCGNCIKSCNNNAKDITFKGFDVYVGGKSGHKIIEGHHIEINSEEKLLKTLKEVFNVSYNYSNGNEKIRLNKIIKDMGFDNFLKEIENEIN